MKMPLPKPIMGTLLVVLVGAVLLFATAYLGGAIHAKFVTSNVTCDYDNIVAGAEACQVTIQNLSGTTTMTTGSCSLTYGGATYSGEIEFGGPIGPGGDSTVECSHTAATGAGAGAEITGSIHLTNGGNATFSGMASS